MSSLNIGLSINQSMFRKVVSEGVKRLQSGEQWTALLDYTIIAWGYVQVTYKLSLYD